jgi:hypothetical protein
MTEKEWKCIYENLCNENPRDWEIPERKTRKDLLIENFPFAEFDGQGIPKACAKQLGITDECFSGQGIVNRADCEKCWAEEIEND